MLFETKVFEAYFEIRVRGLVADRRRVLLHGLVAPADRYPLGLLLLLLDNENFVRNHVFDDFDLVGELLALMEALNEIQFRGSLIQVKPAHPCNDYDLQHQDGLKAI